MRSSMAWFLVPVASATLVIGCLGGPKMRPQVIGSGDLAAEEAAGNRSASGLDLPKAAPGCPPGSPPGCTAVGQRGAYVIGPLDQLSVLVWGRTDLGSQAPAEGGGERRTSEVRQDGTINLPFLGAVPVAGQTLREIEERIAGRYAEIVEAPQVEVQLASCRARSVEVEGAVARPGTVALCLERLTVAEVLAAAGGLLPEAEAGRGTLMRQGAPFTLDYRRPAAGAGDVLLEDGDLLHFPRVGERRIYIFGEVGRQGVYPIPPEGLEILSALGQAGGPAVESAQTRRFYLVRPATARPVVYQLDFSDILQGPRIALADGDRLFVPPTGLAKWNRFWRQVLPVTIYGAGIRTVE